MTNTLILAYADRGLCVFKATDENLKKLTDRVIALKVEGDDFTNAATRLMDATVDRAKFDQADLDMTIMLALNQIGGADVDDPNVKRGPRWQTYLKKRQRQLPEMTNAIKLSGPLAGCASEAWHDP